jgi:hypothetical protein
LTVTPAWSSLDRHPEDERREILRRADVLIGWHFGAELLDEAGRGYGGRMMSVGIHSRWSGQPGRASAVRDFIDYARQRQGVSFMRRIDIARYWQTAYPPPSR